MSVLSDLEKFYLLLGDDVVVVGVFVLLGYIEVVLFDMLCVGWFINE